MVEEEGSEARRRRNIYMGWMGLPRGSKRLTAIKAKKREMTQAHRDTACAIRCGTSTNTEGQPI